MNLCETNFELTPREKCVVGLVARGYSNRDIARELELQPHTVLTMLRTAKLKVRAKTRAELISTCLDNNLLEGWL